MRTTPFGHTSQTPEAAFLCTAVRGERPSSSRELIESAERVRDWQRVVALALQHGVSSWLLRAIGETGETEIIPAEPLETLRSRTLKTTIDTMHLAQALEEALLGLEAEGIPAIVLKGPAVAERFYPDPALRSFRDIDLLLPLAAHASVARLLKRLGYEVAEDHGGVGAAIKGTYESPREIDFVHRGSGVRLEVHYDHLQTGLRPRALDEIWQRSVEWSFNGIEARVLALDDLFLFLCVHLNKHGFSGLAWFKDLDLIVRRHGHEQDWSALAEAGRVEGVETSIAYAIRLLVKILDTPLTEGALDLAKRSSVIHRLLWREGEILNLGDGRWRRAMQFAPREGLRGALPSIFVMGRRQDRLRSLGRRLLG